MIKEESKNKLYSFFAWQNISVKLGAIALALLLWIFVMSENEYTITTDIPIEVRNLPARLVLQEKVPKVAKIRIRGQGRSLFKTFILKTLTIDNECIIKFLKLILDGPKYLVPLSDGIVALSFATFASEPEKLLQVALSLIIFSTVDFGKQV